MNSLTPRNAGSARTALKIDLAISDQNGVSYYVFPEHAVA
jgi:hypothetical protein